MDIFNQFLKLLEKIANPFQLWLTLFVVSSLLRFNSSIQETLKLSNFVEKQSDLIGLIILFSGTLFIIKFLLWTKDKIFKLFHSKSINYSNLTEEETAILWLFVKTDFQDIDLQYKHLAVIKLQSRNLIELTPLPIYISSPFETFSLTPKAKQKLKSKKFRDQHLKELNEAKMLHFINSITLEDWSVHSPQNLT